MLNFFIMFSLLLLSGLVVTEGQELRIHNADEFIKFGADVADRKSFEGTTVLLDCDIDFTSKVLNPIGREGVYFRGTFDGQGHVIRNLLMNSTDEYVGLFGYINDGIIKNLIIDSTSTISSIAEKSVTAYVGGFVGFLSSAVRPGAIKNCVNMATVSFVGDNSYGYLYLGGFIGLSSSIYKLSVSNCANYGTVTNIGKIGYARVGGFFGYISGNNRIVTTTLSARNCVNYGPIVIRNETVKFVIHLGDIVGETSHSQIENCVSYGKIHCNEKTQLPSRIGGIVGYLASTSILNSYWSEEIEYDIYGYMEISAVVSECASFDKNLELNESVSFRSFNGTSLVEALNAFADYFALREYAHWIANPEKKNVKFTINGTPSIKTNVPIILSPAPLNEGKAWFNAWYTDSECTKPLPGYEITEDTDLYGKYDKNTKQYTISFDAQGGIPAPIPITKEYGTVIMLPKEPVKDVSYTVDYWVTEYGDPVEWLFSVPAHNITLYPVWIRNRLATMEDFTEFARNVSNGVDFNGETIILGSDLDFEGVPFEPIGKDVGGYFRGLFDGRGHTIKNLKMESSSDDVGLFGYTKGMTIKDLVIDSSCSFVGTNSTHDVCMGGFIGRCEGRCIIENCVNKASLNYSTNNSNSNIYMGGIVGIVEGGSDVNGCINRGAVSHYNDSYSSRIGGIVGMTHGIFSIYIQNSENYGDVTHRGKAEYDLEVNGIVGLPSQYTFITNCKNHGKIDSGASSLFVNFVVLFVLVIIFF